jgi:hypothetical protein
LNRIVSGRGGNFPAQYVRAKWACAAVFGCVARSPSAAPYAVALCVSTPFASPAVTPAFITAQLVGMIVSVGVGA